MTRTKVLRLLGVALFAACALWVGWYWAPLSDESVRCISWPQWCRGQWGTLAGRVLSEMLESIGVYDSENAWLYTQALPVIAGWFLRTRLGALIDRAWVSAVAKI
jgi:hypothetical protein